MANGWPSTQNIPGVYKITCLANGRFYIGQSTSIIRRWATHLQALKKGKHHSKKLQVDYNEFGLTQFSFTIIQQEADTITREALEQQLIRDAINDNIYNTIIDDKTMIVDGEIVERPPQKPKPKPKAKTPKVKVFKKKNKKPKQPKQPAKKVERIEVVKLRKKVRFSQ